MLCWKCGAQPWSFLQPCASKAAQGALTPGPRCTGQLGEAHWPPSSTALAEKRNRNVSSHLITHLPAIRYGRAVVARSWAGAQRGWSDLPLFSTLHQLMQVSSHFFQDVVGLRLFPQRLAALVYCTSRKKKITRSALKNKVQVEKLNAISSITYLLKLTRFCNSIFHLKLHLLLLYSAPDIILPSSL